ncbi:hypothetical protein OAV88_02450 [bacterium]|nr:hypothetical protein [bacterium]
MGNEMSCCRAPKSGSKKLDRDLLERRSQNKKIVQESKTSGKNREIADTKSKTNYLNMNVFDDYVFARNSRIPHSDSKFSETDIYIKVPMREITGLRETPPSPVCSSTRISTFLTQHAHTHTHTTADTSTPTHLRESSFTNNYES